MHNVVIFILLLVFWEFFVYLFLTVITLLAVYGLYKLVKYILAPQKYIDGKNWKGSYQAASPPYPLSSASPIPPPSKRPIAAKVIPTGLNQLSISNTKDMLRDVKKNGALIIDKPWIDLILSGLKTWEMRSTKFKKTGYIALIAKGTKTIVGVAKIQGFEGPLSIDELTRNGDKHKVPQAQFSAENYKWFVAMKLSDILRFSTPIPYQHKSGSVIWVKLMDQPEVLERVRSELTAKIAAAQKVLDETKRTSEKSCPIIINTVATKVEIKQLLLGKKSLPGTAGKIPSSVKGKVFTQDLCSKDGLYHIKLTSKEYRFESSSAALNVLRKLETAQWATFDKRGRRVWQNTNEWAKTAP